EDLLRIAKRTAPDLELVAVPFALDPVVLYVHHANPVAGLSLVQVAAIIGRNPAPARIATWGELGVAGALAAEPIAVTIAGSSIGQQEYLRKAILNRDE